MRYIMQSDQVPYERRHYRIYDTQHPDWKHRRPLNDPPSSTHVYSTFNGTRARKKLAELNGTGNS